jgi:membrane protease YdiL (CAAX protease family)
MKKDTSKKNPILKTILTVIVALAWVGFVTIAAQFIVAYPMFWILGRDVLDSPLWTTIYAALVYVVSAFLVIVFPKFLRKTWKSTRESLGLTELPTFTDIGLALLGFIATLIVSGYVLQILQGLNLVDAAQSQDVGYNNLMSGFDRAIAFIALVVITPFFEELIFRGWLYRKLKGKIGAVVSAILVAILFGVLHGQWNVGITVGIMSLVICIEQELTGTIYAGILTHMIKNGVAFWLLYVISA